MPLDRHTRLLVLLAATALLTVFLLANVLATVFFALTIAYLLVPLQEWFETRGLRGRWATLVTTIVAVLGALIPLTTLGYILYARRTAIIEGIQSIPDEITLEVSGFEYVVQTTEIATELQTALADAAVPLASAVPVLALKFGVFILLVYGLLVRYEAATAAILAAVPQSSRNIVRSLHDRTRATLFAIYVIQVVTGIATGLVAYIVFIALGYEYAGTLAILAGFLQFLPIIGPSVIVIALALWEVSLGAIPDAITITVVGLLAIAALPDIVIRPWLASGTASLPGSLYFVGFVGGILTVGVVGVIAGPLVVALLAETVALLGAEPQPTPD